MFRLFERINAIIFDFRTGETWRDDAERRAFAAAAVERCVARARSLGRSRMYPRAIARSGSNGDAFAAALPDAAAYALACLLGERDSPTESYAAYAGPAPLMLRVQGAEARFMDGGRYLEPTPPSRTVGDVIAWRLFRVGLALRLDSPPAPRPAEARPAPPPPAPAAARKPAAPAKRTKPAARKPAAAPAKRKSAGAAPGAEKKKRRR